MLRFSMLIGVLLSLVFTTCITANAKDKKADPQHNIQSPLTSLYSCANIDSATDRLACYDSHVASLKIAEEKNEIVAIDANIAKKLKREAFGFNLPSLPKLGLPSFGSSDKAEAQTFKVKSIRKVARNHIITLENGQVWRETTGRISYIPKGDISAVIKAKSLGSFSLQLTNGKSTVRGLKVKRIE